MTLGFISRRSVKLLNICEWANTYVTQHYVTWCETQCQDHEPHFVFSSIKSFVLNHHPTKTMTFWTKQKTPAIWQLVTHKRPNLLHLKQNFVLHKLIHAYKPFWKLMRRLLLRKSGRKRESSVMVSAITEEEMNMHSIYIPYYPFDDLVLTFSLRLM